MINQKVNSTHIMNKLILSFILLFLFEVQLNAQSYYDVTFDFDYFDNPTTIISDESNNVFICGWSCNNSSSDCHGFALKIDDNGNELWRIIEDSTSKFHSMYILEDGNIVIAGSMQNSSYINVVRSIDGTTVWSYHETDTLDWWFGSIVELGDIGSEKLWIAKTTNYFHYPLFYEFNSADGTINDIQSHWPSYHPVESSLIQSSDKYWMGTKSSVINGRYDGTFHYYWAYDAIHTAGIDIFPENKMLLVKLNYFGSSGYNMKFLTWDFETQSIEAVHVDLDDTGVVVNGSGISVDNNILITGISDNQLFLWIYGSNFILQEEIYFKYDTPRTGLDVIGLETSEIVIMGTETSTSNTSTDVFIMKRDSYGTVSLIVSCLKGRLLKCFLTLPMIRFILRTLII